MNSINKGYVKVEKFEATLDEKGNWIPVGEALETVEAQNALSIALLMRVSAIDNNTTGWFAGSTSTNPNSASGDLTKPGSYNPQIFISEFPTASPGSIPGEKTSQTASATVRSPNRDGFGVYHGSFRSLGYDDRDSDESKTILTIKHRFDPDITRDRSIRSIGLSMITSLNLAQTFTQTSSQILDVTYTIEIDLSDIQEPVFSRKEKTLRKQLSFPAAYSDNDNLIPNRSVIFPQSKLKEGVQSGIDLEVTSTPPTNGGDRVPMLYHNTLQTNYAFEDPNGYGYLNLTNQIDGIYASQYPTIDYTTATQRAGMLLGSILSSSEPRYEKNIHEWHNSKGSMARYTSDPNLYIFHSQQSIADSSSTPAVQNLFPRNSASALPYQDVDALATGTGTVIVADSDVLGGSGWTGAEDGLAKKYRINITSGGASGVSEYNIQTRDWAGTAGNQFYPRMNPLPYTNAQNSNFNDSDGRGKRVIPFANDVDYGYHGQNPALARAAFHNFNANILTGSVNYKFPEFITYDRTGFTVMHMNDVGKNFESNFSEICQLVVKQNTARDIYVADVSTGLWKIERTVGQSESESTVTRLTASNAADDTTCRGVQVKNDGTIWAIFGEEMCSSADDGSTWTVYNASTGTQFKLSNVADTTSGSTNPQRIFGFTMDRYHSEDRFFIPARDATNLSNADYSYYYFWWSRAGSASGTSDELYTSSGLNYSYQNHSLRAGNDAVWCSKGGLFYAMSTSMSSQVRVATYRSTTWYNQGSAWSSTFKTPAFGKKAHWWQDDTGEEWILGASYDGTNTPLVAVRSDRFDSDDNTVNYSFFGGTLSGTSNNPHEDGGKRLCDGFFSGDGDKLYGTTTDRAYMMQGMVSPTRFITVPHEKNYMQIGLPGSSFDSAGSPNVGDWINYGWNGSSWVEGSTSTKSTHTSRDSLIDGLTIKFDGTDAGSFVSTECYDVYLYNGILKDDATTFSVGVKHSYLDVDTTTDFASTVPASSVGTVTEPVYLGLAQNQSSRYTTQRIQHWAEQGNWSVVQGTDNVSYPMIMRSEQEMQGDLEITFKLAEMNLYSTQPQGARIGLVPLHTNPENAFHYSAHSDFVQFKYGGRPNTTDSAGDLTLTFAQGTGSVQSEVALTDYNPNDVFKIERTSGNVKWYRNNGLIHTSNLIDDNEKVNFFLMKDAYGAGNVILKDITATYIDSDGPRVTVGDGVSTGVSNPDFRKIVSNSTTRDDYNEIFIDGVPATINYDYSLPPAGECTILPHSGKIRFDPTDAGATITGKIGYLKKF